MYLNVIPVINKLLIFWMIFSKIVRFRIRIRIHNLQLRIRILQKVSDPCGSGSGSGSGSTTLDPLISCHSVTDTTELS
jgi:hypothetical protein